MDFALTEDAQTLVEVARRALAQPFDHARARQLGWFDDALSGLDRVLLAEECGRAGRPAPFHEPLTDAGEALGIAGAAYAIAVEHASTRTQFGRPLGSFQAVAFPIVDVYAAIELARSSLWRAAGTLEPGDALVASALLETRRAALVACETAIQTLGAFGLTEEGPLAGRYRRALALAAQPPTERELHRSIADALGARA